MSVEALELHYRINASILKYLELHEGKDIPNTLGDFFKRCLNKSKYVKKSVPKEVCNTVVKETTDKTAKTADPLTSTGFQEQFLNSLNKLGSDNVDVPAEDVMDTTVKQNQDETKLEDKKDSADEKEVEKMNTSDGEDINIVEETVSANVITISDSEDEREKKGEYIFFILFIFQNSRYNFMAFIFALDRKKLIVIESLYDFDIFLLIPSH